MTVLKLHRAQMVSSTDMVRRFAEYLERTVKGAERLYVTKNNEIQAVLMSIEDFERLVELEDIVEHLAIKELIETRRNEPAVISLEALLQQEGLNADELRSIDPD